MALKIYTLDAVDIADSGTNYPLSAEPLFASSVSVQADYNNSVKIALGGDNLGASNGIEIPAGESAVIEYAGNSRDTAEFDVSKMYVRAATGGQIARVAILKRE